jgi:hypothetical protein
MQTGRRRFHAPKLSSPAEVKRLSVWLGANTAPVPLACIWIALGPGWVAQGARDRFLVGNIRRKGPASSLALASSIRGTRFAKLLIDCCLAGQSAEVSHDPMDYFLLARVPSAGGRRISCGGSCLLILTEACASLSRPHPAGNRRPGFLGLCLGETNNPGQTAEGRDAPSSTRQSGNGWEPLNSRTPGQLQPPGMSDELPGPRRRFATFRR